MKLFAISDLHLSGHDPKPMDIFGAGWQNHWEKIMTDWQRRVTDDDLVLIGGDISWAMQLEAAQVDLDAIGTMPGKKLLLRGNHDYWWGSLSRVRSAMPEGMYVLQNDAWVFDHMVIAGTRGWNIPGGNHTSDQDRKIYARELQRLELSLKDAQRKRSEGMRLVAMLHFPPFDEQHRPSAVTELLEQYGVSLVVYGHLHGGHIRQAFEGELRGIQYRLVSCDKLNFALCCLDE